MSTNTKIAYWLHDRAAEMIDGDDDTFPDALRALVKRLLLEEKAAESVPAERKPVAGWEKRSAKWWTLRTPLGEAWAFADGAWTYDANIKELQSAASLEAAQLAAEDALFAIADAINALRGGR